jgi:two-component system phosphate regulon sensor histidine kinase PhoR
LTEERDPNHRIILRTVIDSDSRIVGVLGFIVDESFVRERLLQPAIDEPFPRYFPGSMATNVVVSIFDRDEKLLHASPQTTEGLGDTVSYQMPFLFTDWKLQVVSRNTTPQQLAQNFIRTNLLLSGLATLSILGCVGLALYSASKLMKVSQMKSEFVSNVSHELRTPLASIRVFGEFLKSGRVSDDEKMREYGDYIETESRRLTALINNILDFSKIEQHRKEYKFESTDVSTVVGDVVKAFEMQAQEHGFRIVYDKPKTALPFVSLDRDALTQALMNLLDNAVKYSMENGWREIGVKLRHEKNSIKISVQDHGIGIAAEEQNKIFDKFYRVSTGLVHDVKGSGLGLAIVKHIAEAHGGEITVESDPEKGSKFTLHLPVRDSDAPARETQKHAHYA